MIRLVQEAFTIVQQKDPLVVMIVSAVLFLAVCMNAASAASVADVALMKTADRQKLLVEGARKEGKFYFYTGLIVDQLVRPLKAAFEKEYPFLEMDFYRGNSERVAQRVILKYQEKKYEVDVISGSASTAMVQRAGFMQQFTSPYLADYPAKLKDPKGFWASTNVYFLALGYNTRSVRPGDVPKSYEDLLQPRWKGQMLWGTSRDTGAPLFIGNILLTMGPEAGKAYLQKLKGQNIVKSSVSARQILDLVVAGESPIALQILNHHAYISKTAGAPVDWQVLEPAPATISSIGMAKNAPHPHAAMLFLDFVLSKKGQTVIQAANYLPSHPDGPALQPELKPGGGPFKNANYMSPDLLYEKGNEWADYFDRQFMK